MKRQLKSPKPDGSMTKINDVLIYLKTIYPHAKCELIYHFDYELLIAVMLSAQTNDKAVNKTTRVLFSIYKTLSSLSKAETKDIEKIIKSIGLSKKKAKNIIAISNRLIKDFDGIVPNNKDALLSLDGVGEKTANVVLAELFHKPLLAVDTHVARIAKRLQFVSENDSVISIQHKLEKLIKKSERVLAHHLFIAFGRDKCCAKKPLCEDCKIRHYCSLK